MTIFPGGKGASVTRGVFQPTKQTPIKPSLLLLTNTKENEIIDLIYDHASLIRQRCALLRCLIKSTDFFCMSRTC